MFIFSKLRAYPLKTAVALIILIRVLYPLQMIFNKSLQFDMEMETQTDCDIL